MASATNPDRSIRLYFGQPTDPRPTKEEVAAFITDELGLTQGDDDPRWSEGIGELIALGMDAWEDTVDTPETNERIAELEDKLANYRRKVERLEAEAEKRHQRDGALDAADRVHRIEARILGVLCQDNHQGAHSMNYVELSEVANQTGHPYSTVVQYAESLQKFAGNVTLDKYGEKAKATNPDAFIDYCESARIDPEEVRRQ